MPLDAPKMTWLGKFIAINFCVSCTISAWTQNEVLPVKCDDFDSWVPQEDRNPSAAPQLEAKYVIKSDTQLYTVVSNVTVTIEGSTDFMHLFVQARAVSHDNSEPIGVWISDDVIETFSCQGLSPDTAVIREPFHDRSITLKWLPVDVYGPLSFVAFITKSDGQVVNTVSDVVRPNTPMAYSQNSMSNNTSKRPRLRRDIQKLNSTKVRAASNGHRTEVSTQKTATTEPSSPTTPPIDLEAFFYYFTIAGAYVGMYTVFSLLLV